MVLALPPYRGRVTLRAWIGKWEQRGGSLPQGGRAVFAVLPGSPPRRKSQTGSQVSVWPNSQRAILPWPFFPLRDGGAGSMLTGGAALLPWTEPLWDEADGSLPWRVSRLDVSGLMPLELRSRFSRPESLWRPE